jgi:hypothetical protein
MIMSNQISTATNVQGPDLSNAQKDTNKFFNNFFAFDMSIGAANDAIVAYFEKYTGNASSGKALAAAVIYTAKAQNLDPMNVLSQFQQLSAGELNSYLAAFLNFNRVPTSTIGIKTGTTTSPYISRSILP